MNPLFDKIVDELSEKHFAVVDNFIENEDCRRIVELITIEKQHFKKAAIGKSGQQHIAEGIRGDFIQWIDESKINASSIEHYLKIIESLRQYINQTLYLGLQSSEVHLTMYPAQTFYKRHLDQHRGGKRKLSFITYLNRNWKVEEGGQLRIYHSNNQGNEIYTDFLPEAGRLVCFLSEEIEHEVLLSYRERFSITGWMLER
jgi:SM-20-related protein